MSGKTFSRAPGELSSSGNDQDRNHGGTMTTGRAVLIAGPTASGKRATGLEPFPD
jgi:hypothetical protein